VFAQTLWHFFFRDSLLVGTQACHPPFSPSLSAWSKEQYPVESKRALEEPHHADKGYATCRVAQAFAAC
jgi:hypothetical protein